MNWETHGIHQRWNVCSSCITDSIESAAAVYIIFNMLFPFIWRTQRRNKDNPYNFAAVISLLSSHLKFIKWKFSTLSHRSWILLLNIITCHQMALNKIVKRDKSAIGWTSLIEFIWVQLNSVELRERERENGFGNSRQMQNTKHNILS